MVDLEARLAQQERYRAQEAEVEGARRRRMRRQPLVLLGLVNVLVLGTGLTAAVDLRRLRTPEGTALAWVQATVFGSCAKVQEYGDAAASPNRTADQRCRDLRRATEAARADSVRIGLDLVGVDRAGERAVVTVLLTRQPTVATLTLSLAKHDGRWRVVPDTATCAALTCW